MSALARHWELKLLALAFSMVLWAFVMTSEKSDLIVTAQLELDGIPAGLEVVGERPDSVDVQLHGLRVALDRLGTDRVRARLKPGARRLAHVLTREARQCRRLLVAHVGQRAPRVDADREARLGLPDVADARDDLLIEQRIADRAPRIVGA